METSDGSLAVAAHTRRTLTIADEEESGTDLLGGTAVTNR
jgi:hypothetical protein